MAAGELIAALAGGAVLGLVILRRQDQSKSTAPQPASSSTSACDKLPAGTARDTCKAAFGVAGIVKGIVNLVGDPTKKYSEDAKQREQANTALNGAPEIQNLPGRICYGPGTADGSAPVNGAARSWGVDFPYVYQQTYRYQNGCVPFAGAPGSEKCAPGTIMQPGRASMMTGFIDYKALATTEPGRIRSSDLASGYFSTIKSGCKFPIPIPAGHVPYFYRGKPFTCPAGTRPDFSVADRRANITAPPCIGAGEKTRAELAANDGGGRLIDAAVARSEQTQVSSGDPNFIFDPACNCWRRKRAGE